MIEETTTETCRDCKHWQRSIRNKHGICKKHHRDILVLMGKYAGIKETDIEAVKNFGCNLFEPHPSCPYCGTELVKRDTYGCGGDETFDWCPDCERVIEDGERMEAADEN